MKLNLFLFVLLLFSSSIFSQRATKNELRVTYTQLPYTPLPEGIKSYTASIHPGEISFKFIHLNKPIAYVETGTSSNYGSIEKAEADFLLLPGYEKVASNGDVKIDVYLKKLTAQNKIMKTGTGKFSEGGKMVERTYYYYEFDYSYYAAAAITGPSNDTIYEKVFRDNINKLAYYGETTKEPREGFGGKYLSAKELEASFQERFMLKQEVEWTRNALLEIKDYLFNYLGKPLVYADFDIISGKGKMDYADLDTAVARMTKAFDEITLNKGDVASAEQFLKDAIGIWEKALTESDPSNNKARINDDITAGLQYNIAIAYVWMRKPDLAQEWLRKASAFKYGERLARKVGDLIESYEKRWRANHIII